MTKKKTIVIVLLLGLLILFMALIDVKEGNKKATMDEWVEVTKEDKYVITVISLSYCDFCANYKPIIEQIAEENDIKLFWFNIDKMKETDSSILVTTYKFNEHGYEGASPYTAITKNAQFVADKVGGMSSDDLKLFLKENGISTVK